MLPKQLASAKHLASNEHSDCDNSFVLSLLLSSSCEDGTDMKVNLSTICKVNSVQEVCAKCFAVHLLKFEIVQTTWKNKKHQNAKSIGEKLKTKDHFFHVICKILHFNMWTPKYLAQASCTELTLKKHETA